MKLADRALNISPSPTLSIDAEAKVMASNGHKVVNFGAGEPDCDTPDYIKEAAIAAIRAGKTKYTPVTGISDLKEAVCEKYRVEQGLAYKPQQVVVSSGAKHSLYNAMQVLVEPGDEVILPAPYWVSYLEQIKLAGATPRIIETREENGFKLTPAELESAVGPRTRLFILNSPNNPTGSVFTEEELSALAEIIEKHGITVISDEIYEKLIYNGTKHVSIASFSSALKEQTIVINGVSKAYAMTGWRIGYTISSEPVAKAMAGLQSHSTSNPSSIAQYASVAALTGGQSFTERMRTEFLRRRNYMYERLNAIQGITCTRPSGAFYLYPNLKGCFGKRYRESPVNSATGLATLLLQEAKVAVVPGIAFGNDNYFRLSYASSLENIKEGLDRIENLINKMN
jgi:aspartate aminotransferase